MAGCALHDELRASFPVVDRMGIHPRDRTRGIVIRTPANGQLARDRNLGSWRVKANFDKLEATFANS
ncbi:hypothetical protein A0H81_12725 [Grifola frondosa]|uniref:Uncharacterized protein n=1 Tax=Grifola frondosa TaxID=5627 RepID=A0A1C7LTK3_GRIFR|nr:hypothetical protein A0H81_12725 [Grifola frondosa]